MISYNDLTDVDVDGYQVTNEDPATLRELALKVKPKRIVGITGGGESVLLSFLPTGAQVVGADVSYTSIAATYSKALLLERHSPGELKKLLSNDRQYFARMFNTEIFPDIPKSLQEVSRVRKSPFNAFELLLDRYNRGRYEDFQKIWGSTPDQVLDSSRERIENLSLLHANIREVADGTGFDLVYISNAMDWRTNNVSLSIEDLRRLTAKGGHVLSSRKLFSSMLLLRNKIRNDSNSNWEYCLYKRLGIPAALARFIDKIYDRDSN